MDTRGGAGAAGSLPSTNEPAPADEHAGGEDGTEYSEDSQVEDSQDDRGYAPFLASMPGAYIDEDDDDEDDMDEDDLDEDDDDFVDEEDDEDDEDADDVDEDGMADDDDPLQQIMGLFRGTCGADHGSFPTYRTLANRSYSRRRQAGPVDQRAAHGPPTPPRLQQRFVQQRG